MSFAEPLALLLLLPVAAAAFLLRRHAPRAGRRLPGAWRQAVAPSLQPALAAGLAGARGGQTMLALAAAALIAAAIARPLADLDNAPDYANLAGRVIVLDLSADAGIGDQRMLAARLVETAGPIPTALVAAAADAYTIVPFTTDRRHLDRYLQVAAPDLMPTPGRALHGGLAHAEGLLRKAGIAVGQIVIVSGGPPPARGPDLARSDTLRVVLPAAGDEAGWQAFAAAHDAALGAPERLTEISSTLDQAVALKLRRGAAGGFTDLAPWLTGLAMALWLGFCRRRSAQ